MNPKPKKEKKKEKKKKSVVKSTENGSQSQQGLSKPYILSMLDELDSFSIEERRATEEKLKEGLIEVKKMEKEKYREKMDISISDIKKEIENLKDIKQKYYDEGDNLRTLDISKKIINLATKYNMMFVASEEKKFVDQLQNKIKETPKKIIRDQIENLKKIRHDHYSQDKIEKAILVSNQIVNLAKKENLTSIAREEEKWLSLMKESLKAKTLEKKIIDTSKLEDIKRSHLEKDSITQKPDVELSIKKTIGKDKIAESQRKYEEERQKFEEEKQRFEEEKEAFKWEKQIFEEAKLKFDQNKLRVEESIQGIKKDSEIKTDDVLEKFEEEQLERGVQKKILEQEKQKFLAIAEQFNQLRMKFDEEKKEFEEKCIKFEEQKEEFITHQQSFEEKKEKFKEEQLEIEQQKKIFEENWLKFEDEKKNFIQDKQKFEEEKELFNWERKMFEELKKHDSENK